MISPFKEKEKARRPLFNLWDSAEVQGCAGAGCTVTVLLKVTSLAHPNFLYGRSAALFFDNLSL